MSDTPTSKENNPSTDEVPTTTNPDTPAIPTPSKPSAHEAKLASLNKSNASLAAHVEELKAAHDAAIKKLKNPEAKGVDTVKRHIHLLHEYNEVRDVALGLMGLVAESRGEPVKRVMEECGIESSERD
ncbi:Swi5-domain-containing protein [Pyronema domesticum]|uniref:Similar to Mating-type switching protein swi5 acc. no. Q9UUB7 n=1 Tax=Pyronema omphalodes (strain CBS 100304) TaxID=1076935 RepID=U4L7K2_PYROM|nr:Swi5-domain-containing protein [Pyronema domesticum]CCX13653.1 Similar to Mating-type switching protein swi5; acc. no. Q9UUB7 [Pyronema omphalodes CBS 100304]